MADKEKHPEIKGTSLVSPLLLTRKRVIRSSHSFILPHFLKSGPVELVVAIPILYAICYAIVIYGGKYIAGPALWATKKVFRGYYFLRVKFVVGTQNLTLSDLFLRFS